MCMPDKSLEGQTEYPDGYLVAGKGRNISMVLDFS